MGPWQHLRHKKTWIFIQLLWITLWHQKEASRVCSFPSSGFRADSNVKILPYCDKKLTCFFLPLKLSSSSGKGCSHHTRDLDTELVNKILGNKLKKSISSQQVQKLLYRTTLTTVSLKAFLTRVLKRVQRVLFLKWIRSSPSWGDMRKINDSWNFFQNISMAEDTQTHWERGLEIGQLLGPSLNAWGNSECFQ